MADDYKKQDHNDWYVVAADEKSLGIIELLTCAFFKAFSDTYFPFRTTEKNVKGDSFINCVNATVNLHTKRLTRG